MLCEIEHHILKLDGPYGPSTARAICKTHGFDMSHMTRIWSGGEMCPIGQIEAARDRVLADILAATGVSPEIMNTPEPPKRTRKPKAEPNA